MTIVCIRNVEFEGAGCIGAWAARSGFDLQTVRAWLGEPVVQPALPGALVVMGGPMSAWEDGKFPWLKDVKGLIRSMVDADRPVLGICLGAQLVADVLGASVYPNDQKEIGWYPVQMTPSGREHPLTRHLPSEFDTFHWHGDTFDLPDGAIHLALSSACRNQAFAMGKVLGLQFHMEMTESGLAEITVRCAHELVGGPFIQDAETIFSASESELNHRLLEGVLDAWIAQ